MEKINIWYTIEKINGEWVVWLNKESKNSYGSFGLYRSNKKKECIDYCKMKGIKYE